MNLLLESLGLSVPRQQEAELVKKILDDHLVGMRCQEALIRSVVVSVVAGLHQLEKSALVKRLDVPASPKPGAHWTLWDMTNSGEDLYRFGLKAVCQRCRQDWAVMAPRVETEVLTTLDAKGKVASQRQVVHAITPATVQKTLDACVWRHCGLADKPSEDLLMLFSNRLSALVGQ